jgi:hypothetical protein
MEVSNLVFANLAGPMIFIGSLLFTFLIVPWERIRELFWVGIVGGLLVAFILVYLMQNIFGFWIFHQVDLLYLLGVPFFLSAAWIPVVIIFSHLLAQYESWFLTVMAIMAFPIAATIIHTFLIANQMLTYHNWNLMLTFLISLAIHLGILGYLYKTGRFTLHQHQKIN